MGIRKRNEFDAILRQVLGSNNVYFQPPESTKLRYNAIVYTKSNGNQERADNRTYHYTQSYDVLVIYTHPDADITEKLIDAFPMCYFSRSYISDGLYHDLLQIFY